ncbi:MAG: NAD(P)/FAD-dependent oxidoreductase, partial [Firmicutes bacterium]|nr:NAD(P)/FAD-dependent oxidoreductase [Bacillota bacterium]
PGKLLDTIAKLLTSDTFSVSCKGSFNIAMATAGGVSLDEISTKTMETKKYPHLFIIGECLDVDGDTGGYNLQFAFSSAFAAANSILK